LEIDTATGAAVLTVVSRKHGTFRVLIDPEDWPRVSGRNWHVSKRRHGFYFHTDIYVGTKRTGVALHRLIMNAPDGVQVDHIRHNYCDNRKSHLRLGTQLQNNANRRKLPGKSSRYKGVSRYKTCEWQASIKINRKSRYLGHCPDTPEGEIDCARLYDCAARELHGEFALLNFPNTSDADCARSTAAA
jgi:HNH endonuclease